MLNESAAYPITIGPHPERRRTYRLESRLWLPRPIDEVFEFFADAFNLQTLTPPWLDFEVLTPPPIEMRSGLLIDYRLRVRGLPIRWQSEILDWKPPQQFVDESRRGPYRYWHHLHTFEERAGGTDVVDIVDYAVPGDAIVNWLLVQRDLRRIFTYRREVLARFFGGGADSAATPRTNPAAGRARS